MAFGHNACIVIQILLSFPGFWTNRQFQILVPFLSVADVGRMFICMLHEMFPIFDDRWCSLGSASSIQCVGSLLVRTMHWIFRRKWFQWVNWLSRKTVWHCWYYRPPLRCAGMRWHLLVWPVHGQCGPSLPESLHRHLSEVESRSNQLLATWHWHPDSYMPIGKVEKHLEI